jgi:heterotetrameric sarcosine oxidase delta subunit
MMMVPCPWCGPRDAGEFRQAGEMVPRPDPAEATPEQWRAYLYLRANARGWVTETWYHRMGCRRYVVLKRHTETHEFRPAPPADSKAPEPRDPESQAAGPQGAGIHAESRPAESHVTGGHP